MSKIRDDRLLKLAKHLESGNLGHDLFDFTVLHSPGTDSHGCGSMGCAIGEMPFVWPRKFKVNDLRQCVVLADSGEALMEHFLTDHLEQFFGIENRAVWHLFYAYYQCPEKYGGVPLKGNASAKAVASNIRAFVTRMNSQETA